LSKALALLEKVIDPELRAPITELGMVEIRSETEDAIDLKIKLTIVGCPAAQKIERDVRTALESYEFVSLEMSTMNQQERDELKQKLRGGKPARFNPFAQPGNLTQVIFVGSGKGGVGKSTITANLAVALASQGFKVGLLDADIFGYSIPGQLGIKSGPTKVDDLMLPPIAYDVRVMSIGFFVTDNQPIAWRGPMLHRAIEQFLTDVYWGDLDFLVVDLPPGTGDVAISLGQLLPGAKSLVITTPQAAAAQVAERSGSISGQVGGEVLGVIENMSYLQSGSERLEIFGSGGGAAVAAALSKKTGQDVDVLVQLPISSELRAASDIGEPLVVSDPESEMSQLLAGLAKKIAGLPRGLSGKRLDISLR
jgi:ATP-binding protein involved in chromosome partitioning